MTTHTEPTNEELEELLTQEGAPILTVMIDTLVREYGRAVLMYKNGSIRAFDPARYELTAEDTGADLIFDQTKWVISGNRLVPIS